MPINNENYIRYWGNANPVCPWCDEVYDIGENEDWELYEEGTHNIECLSCSKEYRCGSEVKYTFSTDEQD